MNGRLRTFRRFGSFGAIALATGLLQAPPTAQEAELAHSEADPGRLAALVSALEQGLPYVPGEILVQFGADADAVQRTAALSVLRVAAGRSGAHWIGDTLLITGVVPEDAESAAAMLGQQPDVVFAQPNYLHRLHAVPNDPLYDRQWNMNQISMPAAWDINPSAGRGVTVAVLDSGLTTHEGSVNFRLPVPPSGRTFRNFPLPFLRPPDFDFARVLPGTEFTPTGPWTVAGQGLLFDADGHGTHVAGTIAQQTNNNSGFAGVANGVTLMPVKVCFALADLVMLWGDTRVFPGTLEGRCDTFGTIAGIHHAVDNGAKVLNLSLGGPFPSPAMLNALNYAVSRGAFVSIAAGNAALEGNPTEYPAAYANDLPGVVAVGATNSRRTRAIYSGFRSYVELAAPGGEGCNGGSGDIWQVAPNQNDLVAFPPRFDRYMSWGICGTSMAAPHVAGAAALLYSQGVTNPAAIEAALRHFAVDLGEPGRDVQYGYGLIDVRATLRGLGLTR